MRIDPKNVTNFDPLCGINFGFPARNEKVII